MGPVSSVFQNSKKNGCVLMILTKSGLLNDLFVFDPLSLSWTDLSSTTDGNPPTPRLLHGFEVFGEEFYAHGGLDQTGGFTC
jgi:hypothetical protein